MWTCGMENRGSGRGEGTGELGYVMILLMGNRGEYKEAGVTGYKGRGWRHGGGAWVRD